MNTLTDSLNPAEFLDNKDKNTSAAPATSKSMEIEKVTVTFEKASQDELPQVADFEQKYFDQGSPYTLADFQKIYDIGEIFIAKNEQGEIVGITSYTIGPKSHEKLKIKEDEAYFSGSVVRPDYRKKTIGSQMNEHREQRIVELGITKIWTCVRSDNKASYNSLSKSGFLPKENKEKFMPEDPKTQDSGARIVMAKDINPDKQAVKQKIIQSAVAPAAKERILKKNKDLTRKKIDTWLNRGKE